MTENKPEQVAKDLAVTIDYKLTIDGEIIDSSEEDGPLDYLHGHENIIPGLERELTGMKIGEQKNVTVAPEDGYGTVDEEAMLEVPRSEFPNEVPLEIGIELEVTDQEGDMLFATIVEVGNKTVKLDTNHPLAGKALDFDVTVVDLREASEEEIAHGHVHTGHHHH
ncbi:MAG TPA: peptidylprolyl isomerase [Anaerolineales bacterium]|nr:peptidylprolyl isomerase [Anaerolineales bacterium]